MGNIFEGSAGGFWGGLNSAGAATDLFSKLATYNPMTVNDPARISGGMSHYMNPYTADVIDRSMADMMRMTGIQQNVNAANAAKSGAFGGARHGLVEATTNAEATRAMGDLSANLRNQGFNTAAQLSAQDIANRLSAGQGMLGGAGALGSFAGLGYDLGQRANDTQMQYGSLAQMLQQAVMDKAGGDFSGTTGQPKSLLDIMSGALGMSPLNQAITTTGQYKPGLFDYLSLIAQGYGAAQQG